MRSRTAVQHRLGVIEARCLGAWPSGSPKALVNRYDVGVTGLEPVTSSL
jgi:hypothetical protein